MRRGSRRARQLGARRVPRIVAEDRESVDVGLCRVSAPLGDLDLDEAVVRFYTRDGCIRWRVPVCSPTAARSARPRGLPGSPRPRSAPGAVGNATKKASPCVSTSTAPSAANAFAHNAAVLREDSRVALGAQFVQRPRRPFDVREQERDRPGRKVAPHDAHQVRSQRLSPSRRYCGRAPGPASRVLGSAISKGGMS
jgi:hypothetical protein